MGVNNRQNVAYSLNQPLSDVFPAPIVSQRAPTSADKGPIGLQWIDVPNQAVYSLVEIASNAAVWVTTPSSGASVVASLTVTGGDIHITATPGNIIVDQGDLTLTAGNAVIQGDLAVTGNVTVTGDFDITDTGSISITSTNDAAGAITLLANGGTSETILIRSAQGTSATSLNLLSTAGGITLDAGLATADAINLSAGSGGIDMDSALLTSITSTRNNAQAILLEATAGGIDILASGASAGEDIDITATGSSVNITSTENAAQAIYLHANGGVTETVQLHADQGTAVNSINLLSDVGGLTLRATGLASADAINLEAAAGGIDMDSALQTNITSSQAAVSAVRILASDAAGGIDIDTGTGGITIDSTGAFSIDGAAASNVTTTGAGIDLTLSSVLGSVLVSSTEDAALAIRLHANGGTSETIQLHSDQGTGVGSINLLSDVGGITLTATGLASADAINLEAPAGGIDMDSALQTNIASAQAAATALRLVASNAAGGIDVDAGTGGITVDTTGVLSLDSAAASNYTVTGAFDLTLSSTAGSVVVSGGEAVADAVQLTAGNAAGGVTIATGTGGVTVNSTNGIIALNSGTAAINVGTDAVAHTVTIGNITGATAVAINSGTGSITLTSTGTGDIVLDSDDTMLLDADGVLELNSSAGAISIGNDADAQAINIGTAGSRAILMGNATAGTTFKLNSPANVGITLQNDLRIITGAGSPNGAVTAPAGSLWLRTDPAGATSRIYVNTDSGTTWTNVTCAA